MRMTEGFNPRPRVVFLHALEVGIASKDEVVEIELSGWIPPREFASRLGKVLPEGLAIHEVRLAPPKRQAAIAVEAHYVAEMDGSLQHVASEGVGRFLSSSSWPFDRKQPDGTVRRIDLRPHVLGLSLEGCALKMKLRLGAPGAARPREVLAAVLGVSAEQALDIPLQKVKTVLAEPGVSSSV